MGTDGDENMNDLKNDLINDFNDKEYRHGYVDDFLDASIATQIKVLREQRGWGQKELAEKANMKQPRISVMENVNYSSWNINTLRRIAEAFDLTLRVSFESFSTRLSDIINFGRENLERQSFDEEKLFKEQPEIDQEKFYRGATEQPTMTNGGVLQLVEIKKNKRYSCTTAIDCSSQGGLNEAIVG